MILMEYGALPFGAVALSTVPQPVVAEEQWWDVLSSLGPVATLAAASIAWAGPLADRLDVDEGVPVNHN